MTMAARAQTIAGTWQGQLAFNQIAFPGQLEIKINNQKVTGRLTLSVNGQTEVSIIEGNILNGNQGRSAYGNITDDSNSSTTFTCLLNGNTLSFSIAVGESFMLGEFTRAASVSSETNRVSTAKANGLKIVDKNVGYSFNVPVGFSNKQDGNGAYLIQKGQDPTGISVSSNMITNSNTAHSELSQSINLNGVMSTIYEAPQFIGNTIVSACHVFYSRGRNVYYYFLTVPSNFESGATVLLVTETTPPTESWKAAALSVARSVSFFKAEKSVVAQQVEQALRGRGLRHLKVTDYGTEDWRYDFCSDGTYAYNSSGQSRSSGDRTLILRGENNHSTGTWQATSRGTMVFLVLTPQEGNPVELPIELVGRGDVYLNKVSYGFTDNQICR